MSQQANAIQRLVERKQTLELELAQVERDLDEATQREAHHGFDKAGHQRHELPNHIILGDE
jgi:hypothetical protein